MPEAEREIENSKCPLPLLFLGCGEGCSSQVKGSGVRAARRGRAVACKGTVNRLVCGQAQPPSWRLSPKGFSHASL